MASVRERRADTPARARELAERHAATRSPGERQGFDSLTRNVAERLRGVYRDLEGDGARRPDERSVEWLLDNEYVVRGALDETREVLTRGFYRDLPKLDSATGVPRVLDLARAILREADGPLDIEALRRFLAAYQRIRPLTIGEVWALPAVLRLTALELLADAVAPPDAAARSAGDGEVTPRWVAVANCIGSLRLIASQDWREFFESVSAVERILRSDPSRTYARMDFETRDRYRQAVEEIARWSDLDELEVARAAVARSREADEEGTEGSRRRAHIGFHLVAEGRRGIEQRAGFRPPSRLAARRWLRSHARRVYFASIAAAAVLPLLVLAAWGYRGTSSPLTVALLLLVGCVPALTAATSFVNWLVAHAIAPRPLPKLLVEGRVPAQHSTVVAVPCLIGEPGEVDGLLERLEILRESCMLEGLRFLLLTDLHDAPVPVQPADTAHVDRAVRGVRRLNDRAEREQGVRPYGLLHRERGWNESERCWMGWERKRGKLRELNRFLLTGDRSPFSVTEECDDLEGTRFVITLDADTAVPRETAARLIGTLAHPLNAPVVEPDGSIRRGYSVLQPRIETLTEEGRRTWFAWLGRRVSGLDLYSHAVSDVYQDLFGEGVYAGKGIYDVAAFESSLGGRVPDNALLSHDLFEGIHGRAGLVTDVVLVEDFPADVLAYTRRLHRWIRGDWQIAPWLLRRVPAPGGGKVENRLDGLARWKIFDNLRRSLVAPGLVALIALGWGSRLGPAWAWVAISAGVLGFPAFLGAASATRRALGQHRARARTRATRRSTRETWTGLASNAGRWGLGLLLVPFEAALALDAIGRTLYRLTVSRRRLLQWTPAAAVSRVLWQRHGAGMYWQAMGGASFVALAAGVWLVTTGRADAPSLAAVGLWTLAPQVAYEVSRPRREGPKPLSAADRRRLRETALRTWLFFERFVTAENHWLPPDNWQEDRDPELARRTSPTNIGMMLVSVVAAYDLGHIDARVLEAIVTETLGTVDRLEKFRGHLLNWYSTEDLVPLEPRYVSSVDSGNLAIALILLERTLIELAAAPAIRAADPRGLEDIASAFERYLAERVPDAAPSLGLRRELRGLRRRFAGVGTDPIEAHRSLEDILSGPLPAIDDRIIEMAGTVDLPATAFREIREWSAKLHSMVDALRRRIETVAPWVHLLDSEAGEAIARIEEPAIADARARVLTGVGRVAARPGALAVSMADAALDELEEAVAAGPLDAETREAALVWCGELRGALARVAFEQEAAGERLEGLAVRCRRLVDAMDFGFLFDPTRKLLRIGFNVTTEEPDSHHYDLLASEARLASYLAIAQGDVPVSHWLHLGRSFTLVGRSPALLSWGATMFEYLLPTVFLRTPGESLLGISCRQAVKGQISFGVERGIPWGISESAFAQRGHEASYQYRAFGVPGLGLRRDLGDRQVVAPYASALALRYEPRAAVRNLARLRAEGAWGRWGLYEALDYGISPGGRHGPTRSPVVVRAFMAHHQGMILAAIDNQLEEDVLVRRLATDPRIAAMEYLLHERMPWRVPLRRTWTRRAAPPSPLTALLDSSPFWTPRRIHSVPQILVLSNGRYDEAIASDGAGAARWRGRAVTRWRRDASRPAAGQWTYLVDRESGSTWSATAAPVPVAAEADDVEFGPHMAEFRRRVHEIASRLRVTVPPEDDVGVRLLTLTNDSNRSRRLTVVTYGEVVLGSQAEDVRHPVYGELFVEGTYAEDLHAIVYRRRPRSEDEAPLFLAHRLTGPEGRVDPAGWELDRARFIGRNRDAGWPRALADGGVDLSGGSGAPLHPIAALSADVELPPYTTRELVILTAVGRSETAVRAVVERYGSAARCEGAFERARHAVASLRHDLGVTDGDLERFQRLQSLALHPFHGLRMAPAGRRRLSRAQPFLWRFGISGDRPILLVLVYRPEESDIALEVLKAQAYWRGRSFAFDVVLVDPTTEGYAQPVRDTLQSVVDRSGAAEALGNDVHLVSADRLEGDDVAALESLAAVVLDSRRGSLDEQLASLEEGVPPMPDFVPIPTPPLAGEPSPPLERPAGLVLDNGIGGFDPDTGEYVIFLGPGESTPAPWSNVIARPEFGTLVTESGGGFTWALNSGENRLTPWHDDPVGDRAGEALYLRDEETGEVWTPTPHPRPAGAPHEIRHGAGYTTFRTRSHGLEQACDICCAMDLPAKLVRVRLTNEWSRTRRITATYYAEWVLGTDRGRTAPHVVTEFDARSRAILARNPFSAEYGDRVAFLTASEPPHGVTMDRAEFLGPDGDVRRPEALFRIGLSGIDSAGKDPCGAYQIHLDIAPGRTVEVHFALGQAASRSAAVELATRVRAPGLAARERAAARRFWDMGLGSVRVETPDPAFDLLMNKWLRVQVLASRVWGRTGFYQSGGAFGFRDQLQDVLALLEFDPGIARAHILDAASHQFAEGDVLHWWHPGSEAGVRTRCSDDLVWLPWVTAAYIARTSDAGILEERRPFLRAPPLEPGEHERYARFTTTVGNGSLYEHCLRALDRASRFGRHGLPLIGTGDWNDGMDRVGIEGRGESVWLGWFLLATLRAFAPLCEGRGDADRARELRARADDLAARIEEQGWDGEWYRRAYYDDGTPLGSALDEEARIDAISQAWAVLSGGAPDGRRRRAMEAVDEHLVHRSDRLLLLLAPPFDRTPRDPGYIKGYPPGVRENGGQYSHAAVWAGWARALLGEGDRAWDVFRMVSPAHRSDPDTVRRYRVEPYAVAADIYSSPPHEGRGGWTWYTGSAAWLYRFGLEAILGIRRDGDRIEVRPCLPDAWDGFEAWIQEKERSRHIRVEREAAGRSFRIWIDGELAGAELRGPEVAGR